MIIALLFVSGLSVAMAYYKENFVGAIWLIATAQLLSAAIICFFIADYWLLGLVQVLIVPLELMIVDHPKRIPWFIVFTQIGIAFMLVVDLEGGTERWFIFGSQPSSAYVATFFVVAQIIVLAGLLWRFRLSSNAPYKIRLNLATQLAFIFGLMITVSTLVVIGVLITQIRQVQTQQVGRNFKALAEVNAERIQTILEQEANLLAAFGRRETNLQVMLNLANRSYASDTETVTNILQAKEARWQDEAEGGFFVQTYLGGNTTKILNRLQNIAPAQTDFILTDQHGGLVGSTQTQKPDHFVYNTEEWWQKAWNEGQGGTYIGQLNFNLETQKGTVLIAVGAFDSGENTVNGVLASTYKLDDIQQAIQSFNQQLPGAVYLVNQAGQLLAGPSKVLTASVSLTQPVLANLSNAIEADMADPISGWALVADENRAEFVTGYAPLYASSNLIYPATQILSWSTSIQQSQAQILAEVSRSSKVAGLVGILIIIAAVVIATLTAQVMTGPITTLTQGRRQNYGRGFSPSSKAPWFF